MLGQVAAAVAFVVAAAVAIVVALVPIEGPVERVSLRDVLIASPGGGFERVYDGPVDERLVSTIGVAVADDVETVTSNARCHVRAWANSATRWGAVAMACQLDSTSSAGEFLRGAFEFGEEAAQQTFAVPGVDGARGYVIVRPDDRRFAQIAFRRDSLVFWLTATPPDPPFARSLAQAQDARAPAGESEAARDPWSQAGFVFGTAFALVLAYLVVLAVVARLGDTGGEAVRGAPTSATTRDVSREVHAAKSDARAAFFMQAAGLCLVLPALSPDLWPDALALVAAGAGSVAAGVALRRRQRGRGGGRQYRRVFTGRHGGRVVVLLAASMLVSVAGLFSMITSVTFGGHPLQQLSALACLGLACLPYRRARRYSALAARELMERDERRPVLYLRSFGDDRLKVVPRRDSPRRSWLERLGIRGRERFEEVIAGHLWAYGPVVAVSEPGESFPPIGSARTHIDGDGWQAGVEELMDGAALIVVSVGVTPGLAWEVARIAQLDLWHKTLLVFPPVPWELRERWQAISDAAAAEGQPLALAEDPSIVLVAARAQDDVIAYVGRSRDEWHYEAALKAAAEALLALPSEVPRHEQVATPAVAS